MNFILISPNFPDIYYNFAVQLKKYNVNVLGLVDSLELRPELVAALTEFKIVNFSNYQEVKEAVEYFISKYGPIDYIESNNEYWLQLDANLRTEFNVNTGNNSDNILAIKSKILMKDYFKKANVLTARYICPSDKLATLDFIQQVQYPVFVKPIIGVGGEDSYKLNNEQELNLFFEQKKTANYIMEEYIDGDLLSFDGLSDANSDVAFCLQEVFMNSGADIVNLNLDDFYYVNPEMSLEFYEIGKRVVKAFSIYKRIFHIEFFKLRRDSVGLGNKGDYVAIEVNMRPPGGNTLELIDRAFNINIYELYAKQVIDLPILPLNITKKYASTSSRKDIYNYKYSLEQIFMEYADNIFKYGRYPKQIALEMGDTYFYAVFNTLEEVIKFDNFVRLKV
jgi:hypothetical protein